MDLGLGKPDDSKDKARLILICICRINFWILTEVLLKIKSPKILRGDILKCMFGLVQGDSLKANEKHNSPRIKEYFYGR